MSVAAHRPTPETPRGHSILSVEQLLHERNIDQLTGLRNRLSFTERLPHILEKNPGETALIMIDLDGFKKINDTYGHSVGDKHLIKSATYLRQSTDERPGDEAYRFGGDEFAIVARGIHRQEDLDTLIARIQSGIDTIGEGGSVGGARHIPGQSAEELIAAADQAMYEVKENRKKQAFEALPRRKQIAAKVGNTLLRYADVDPPR